MQRAAIISVIALVALTIIVALSAVMLFRTAPGRGLLSEWIETALEGELGGEAEIGALTGALPGEIILTEVVFSENGAAWLTARRIEIEWLPMRLLRKRIDLDRAFIEDAALLAAPPKKENDDTRPPRAISLPDNLPHIHIHDFAIADLTIGEAFAGRGYTVNGSGSLAMGDGAFRAVLHAASDGARDTVAAILDLDPDRDRLFSDITITSAADGVIATLADTGGAVYISAQADAPISNGALTLSADAGGYGRLEARLLSNLNTARSVGVEASFFPGGKLQDIAAEFGPELQLTARLAPSREGGTLTVQRFASAVGDIKGAAEWTNARRALDRASISLESRFADEYRPALLAYLGPEAILTADLRRGRDDYLVDAALTGAYASASLSGARTNLRDRLSAKFAATLFAREAAPLPLQAGAAIDAALTIGKDRRVALSALTLSVDSGARFTGSAVYDGAEKVIDVQGAASAGPDFVALLAPAVRPEKPVFAQIDLSGPLDRLTLEADIDAPRTRMGAHFIPAASVEAALAGLPLLPTGEITGRAVEGGGRFALSLRSAETGRITVPNFRYAGAGFALAGAGALDPAVKSVTLDLKYQGAENATPLPGVTAAGTLSVKGTLAGIDNKSDLTFLADDLRINDFAISSLEARAKGPSKRLEITASGDGITLAGAQPIRNLALEALADLSGPPRITLNALEAEYGASKARLTAPAKLIFGEETEIENLRALWGDNGVIALDGAFSNAHWRANADVNGVLIPGASGMLSFRLDLDTDRQIPARGVFIARSLLTLTKSAEISGAMTWNGASLRLQNTDPSDVIDFDISLPVRLTRSGPLSIKTGGELDGYARYKGELGAIAAYLPPTLQDLEGALSASIDFEGTLENPRISGRADIRDAAYTEMRSGLSLAGLHAHARTALNGDMTTVLLTAGGRGADQTGADTITFLGELALGETPHLKADLTFDKATISAGPVSSATATGAVKLEGPPAAITASGAVTINEMSAEIVTPKDSGLVEIDVVTMDEEAPPPATTAPRPPLIFDVQISAPGKIFVRGRGLESEWRVDVRASGDAEQPVILGALNLRRGWFDFSGRRFNLTEGRVAFDSLVINDPQVTARAEHQTAGGVTAIIVVSGRASAPKIELQSSPAMPAEDVMALVLFGKSAQELTALESLQAAQALAALSGVGPFGGKGAIGSIRQALRLDLLNFDIDPEHGGGSLTVGKYVVDKLFVSATQDAQGQNGSVRLQYEITNSIALETEMKQDGEQTVSANWKKDF